MTEEMFEVRKVELKELRRACLAALNPEVTFRLGDDGRPNEMAMLREAYERRGDALTQVNNTLLRIGVQLP